MRTLFKQRSTIRISLILFFFASAAFPQSGVREKGKRELLLFEEIPIVVAAAKHPQFLEDAQASVTIITGEEIKKYGYNTLADVLKFVEEYNVIYDRNYEYVSVRGFSMLGDYNTRILLLLNGHTLNDDWIGANLIGTDSGIDLDIVKRIEIIRGPGSPLYGTNAFFGVVNVITKEGSEISGSKVSTELGSFGRKKGILSVGNSFSNGLDILLSGSIMDTKGGRLYFSEFDNGITNGYTEGTDYDKSNALFAHLSYSDWTVIGKASLREKGVPTAPYGTAFNDKRTRTVDARSFLELKLDHKFKADRNLMGRVYFDHFYYDGRWIIQSPDNPINWDKAIGCWVGGEFQLNQEIGEKNRLILGVEGQSHRVGQYNWWEDNSGKKTETPLDENRSSNFLAFYLQDEWKMVEQLAFTFGIHHDQYECFGGVTNPRIASIFKPALGTTFKLLYGKAFRIPSIYEHYYTDGSTMIGNNHLTPEKIWTSEGVWEQKLGRLLKGKISFYRNLIQGLILQVENEEGFLQYQNLSDIEARGIEGELKGEFNNGVRGYTNFTYQTSKELKSKEHLVNLPAFSGNSGIIVSVIKEKFFLGLNSHYVGKRLTRDKQSYLHSYLLTNLTLSLENWPKGWEISGRVYNLFDFQYADPGGEEHVMLKIPQDRRNFQLKIGYLF